MDKAAFLDFVIEIVRKMEGSQGFEVLPRRWVVERTFGWMMRWRRLVRDYEQRIGVCVDVHRNTANAHVVCAANDPPSDLTAIGNEQCHEAHRRNTPYPFAPSIGVLRTTERQIPSAVLVSRGSMMSSSKASRATW